MEHARRISVMKPLFFSFRKTVIDRRCSFRSKIYHPNKSRGNRKQFDGDLGVATTALQGFCMAVLLQLSGSLFSVLLTMQWALAAIDMSFVFIVPQLTILQPIFCYSAFFLLFE